MKIEGADITIYQNSVFNLELTDSVQHCFIQIKRSEPGVKHPIIIKSSPDLVFQFNMINSEIPEPILVDGIPWPPGLGDNCFYLEEEPSVK